MNANGVTDDRRRLDDRFVSAPGHIEFFAAPIHHLEGGSAKAAASEVLAKAKLVREFKQTEAAKADYETEKLLLDLNPITGHIGHVRSASKDDDGVIMGVGSKALTLSLKEEHETIIAEATERHYSIGRDVTAPRAGLLPKPAAPKKNHALMSAEGRKVLQQSVTSPFGGNKGRSTFAFGDQAVPHQFVDMSVLMNGHVPTTPVEQKLGFKGLRPNMHRIDDSLDKANMGTDTIDMSGTIDVTDTISPLPSFGLAEEPVYFEERYTEEVELEVGLGEETDELGARPLFFEVGARVRIDYLRSEN